MGTGMNLAISKRAYDRTTERKWVIVWMLYVHHKSDELLDGAIEELGFGD